MNASDCCPHAMGKIMPSVHQFIMLLEERLNYCLVQLLIILPEYLFCLKEDGLCVLIFEISFKLFLLVL